MEIKIDKYEYEDCYKAIEKELRNINIVDGELEDIPDASYLVDLILEKLNIKA